MIHIDITDLLIYVKRKVRRNEQIIPTGVERVMLEFIVQGITHQKVDCIYFSQAVGQYLTFPNQTILDIYDSNLANIQQLKTTDVYNTNILRLFVRYQLSSKFFLMLLKYYFIYLLSLFKWRTFVSNQKYKRTAFGINDTILFLCAPCILRNLGFLKRLKKQYSLSIIMLMHDLMPITLDVQYLPSIALKRETVFFIKKAAIIIDRFLIATKYWQNILNDYLASLGSKIPINIIKFGFNGHKLTDDLPNTAPQLNGKFILTVSTISSRKNHINLVKAWHILLNNNKLANHKLVIVGKWGWKVNNLKQYIIDHPELNNTIVFLNHVNDNDLRSLYQHCSFTMFPSIAEGYGLPIVESIYHKKLCIASNTTAMTEVSSNGVEYINPLDIEDIARKMEYYLQNPQVLTLHTNRIHDMPITTWEEAGKFLYDTI